VNEKSVGKIQNGKATAADLWTPGQADTLRQLIATDVRSETSRVA
jgi:hypothetical protein